MLTTPKFRPTTLALLAAAMFVLLSGCEGLFYDLEQLDISPLGAECSDECVAPANGTAECVDGVCQISCDDNFELCGSDCIDPDTESCESCDPDAPPSAPESCESCDPEAHPFGGGDGTAGQPYLLCDVGHIEAMRTEVFDDTGHFAVVEDIDIGGEWLAPLPEFTGVFDGQNNTISGLRIETDTEVAGLFSSLAEDGQIRNLTLANIEVHADWSPRVGAVVGQLSEGASVVDVSVDGALVIGGELVGGVVGKINRGRLQDVSVTGLRLEPSGAIDRSGQFGGVAGSNSNGQIVGATASGTIHSDSNDLDVAGGLVGDNSGRIDSSGADVAMTGQLATAIGGLVGRNSGDIIRCRASGDVGGRSAIGGLVGQNKGNIDQSYASGAVGGDSGVGGLVGMHEEPGAIQDSYATGSVSGSMVGGLVGEVWPNTTIWHSYSAGAIEAVATGELVEAGGFVGFADEQTDIFLCYWDTSRSGFDDGFGTSTQEDQTADTYGLVTDRFARIDDDDHFTGWDFDNIWELGKAPDKEDRPILQWQTDRD